MTAQPDLSPHCRNVLAALKRADAPMTAYDLLDALRPKGVKAPPTVYRALETLQQQGLIHRIETLGAFIACDESHGHGHGAQFAVCRACGDVTELHDHHLLDSIRALCAKLKFRIEREMLELTGLCAACQQKAQA